MFEKKITNQIPTFIDLFSGAGGFSLGFVQAGYRDLLAIENDKNTAATYELNFPQTVMMKRDIRTVHSLDIMSKITDKPDIILASPPCEPFTSANPKRKKNPWARFHEDPQGDLIFHAIRIIGDIHPQFFVIENVVPIAETQGKQIIKDALITAGYNKIYFNFIRAEEHGCPSSRNRLFISNIHIILPKKKKIRAEDVLNDLPNPSYPNDFYNHFYVHFPKKIEKKVHKIAKGRAGVYFSGATREKRNWIRIAPKETANTIMGKSRFIHPEEDRALTIREHARLMGFSDNFKFVGSADSMFNQVGEAVPPIIAKQIGDFIKNKIQL